MQPLMLAALMNRDHILTELYEKYLQCILLTAILHCYDDMFVKYIDFN